MGKVGKVVAGVALIVTGVVVGVFSGQWQLGLALASSGAGLLMQPRIPSGDLNERQGAILENRAGGLDHLPVVYGTVRIAGVFADIRVDPTYQDRKRLITALAFCHGSRDGTGVTAIDELWFDNRLAAQGTVVQSPFSTVQPNGIAHLEFTHHLGSTTQVIDGQLYLAFPAEWPATSAGKGVCYSRIDLYYNTDIYPGGLPTIQAKIRGNAVYDPRDSTWKFSSNPALCLRDYLLSTIYGMGVPEANLDEQSFIDMANYCDELVNIPGGGTQKRFELNGWVDTARPVEQNLAELATACRGQLVNEGEKWRLLIRRARAVSGYKITQTNTLEGSWQFVLPGSDLAYNVGRAAYVEPERNYDVDSVQWPEPGQSNAFLSADNDFEQRLEIDLPYTQNRLMAQQIVMTLLKESREAIGAICTLKEEALQVRVGDLVEVTQPTPGWVDKVFDVAALFITSDGAVRAVLVEYEPTVYDLDSQFSQPAIADTNLPNPFTVAAPTSLVLTSTGQELQTNDGRYTPRIRATWAKANDPFVDYYEIQAKKTADTSWDTYGRHPGLDDALFFVYPVTDEQWSVRIRAVNTIGRKSDWVTGTLLVVTPDPRPQVLSVTLTNAHVDTAHVDTHTDVAHGDAGHSDAHTDTAHTDHTDHNDAHSDSGAHDDTAHDDTHGDVGEFDTDHTDSHSDSPHSDHSDGHGDSHTDSDHGDVAHDDSHGDVGAFDTDHTDTHSDQAHSDHTDTGFSHSDVAHVDTHTDVGHSDSAHSDGHTDVTHNDGQHGIGVAVQADMDSASIKAVALKGSDPTLLDVQTQAAVDGRNVVLELVDAATGAQIQLSPGDVAHIAVVAYSEASGGGVEGPLARARAALFSVAPVGTDKWVPSA